MNCESRVALIGIVVSDPSSVTRLNEYLHECAHYIIGRMGVPYEKAGVSIISVAIDAPQDVINTLSGKLGALKGVTSKTIYQKLPADCSKEKEAELFGPASFFMLSAFWRQLSRGGGAAGRNRRSG